ncbi:hypothetical protein HY251_03695 [bacterium]|nr:hypothetical protein [bacterium]
MRATRALLAATVVSLALARDASAQTPAIDVDLEVGFENCLLDDAWTPVRVTLTAPAGSLPISGRVVTSSLALERVSACEAPFTLAPTSDQRATVTVLIALPPQKIFADLAFTLRVEDEHGREIAQAGPHDLPRRIGSGERLALVVPKTAGLAALSAVAPRAPPGPPPQPPASGVRVAHVAARDLPTRSWLLQGASTIFLKHDKEDPGVRELAQSPERVAALAAFVRSGRSLIVIGGSMPFWKDTPLDELLPVNATGDLAAATSVDLAFLGLKEDPLAAAERKAPFVTSIARATLRPGARVQKGTADSPLVALREIGRGHVYFLAFDPDDPALRGAPGLASFLERLVRPPEEVAHHPDASRLALTSANAFFERSPVGAVGLLGLGLAVIAAVAILGPFAAQRRLAPVRTFAAPLLSCILAAVIVLVAWIARSPSQANVLTYVFSESRSDEALAVADVGLYSRDETTFEVELVGNASVLPLERQKTELLSFRSRGAALRLAHGAAPLVTPIEAPAQGFAWVRVGSAVELPPAVRVRASVSPGPPDTIEVEALAGDLPEGGLVFRAGSTLGTTTPALVLPLGKVARGETRALTIDREHGARPLADRLREEEEKKKPLWERDGASAQESHLLAALRLIQEETTIPVSNRGGPGAPLKDEGGFPKVWVALPGVAPDLARASARGKPLEGRSLVAYLISAEEGP